MSAGGTGDSSATSGLDHRDKDSGVESFLRALGLSEDEEQICLHVFRASQATITGLAKATGLDRRHIRTALDNLEAHALVAHTADPTPRYVPTPPTTGLEALGLVRKRELEQSLAQATATLTRLYQAATDPGDLIEVVTEPVAMTLRASYAGINAVSDVMVFCRPPFVEAAIEPEESFTGWREGVRARYIFDQETLELPGFLHRIESTVKPGEEYRVVPQLPRKLTIIDKQIAFMPATRSDPGGVGLIVRSSALLEALVLLFEKFWQEGLVLGDAENMPTDEQSKILALLATGLTDDAIARHLGMSTRSLRRRIALLQEGLGARNRFQAGAQAVRRGQLE